MLEARDLGFRHAGASLPLFEGLSLSVSPVERLALRAPSGFGKTTLCRLLAGCERPRAGQVLIDGVRLPERGVCMEQLINQHPERVLDPRLRMASSLAEAGEPEGRVLDGLGIQAGAHGKPRASPRGPDAPANCAGVQYRDGHLGWVRTTPTVQDVQRNWSRSSLATAGEQ